MLRRVCGASGALAVAAVPKIVAELLSLAGSFEPDFPSCCGCSAPADLEYDVLGSRAGRAEFVCAVEDDIVGSLLPLLSAFRFAVWDRSRRVVGIDCSSRKRFLFA